MNKYEKILEFDKILEKVSKYVILEDNIKVIEEYQLMDNLEDIERSLDEVDEALILKQRMGRFPIYCTSAVRDLLIKTTKYGVLTADELFQVSKFLNTLKDLFLYLEQLHNNEITCKIFEELVSMIVYPKSLNLSINNIINQFGEIKDTASSNLKEIRRKIKDYEKNIQIKLSEIVSNNISKLSEAIISIRNDRYVIPVKNEYKNTIKGITHDISSSGETVFIEPLAVFEMNNNLNRLYEKENEEIYNILKLISSEIGLIGHELIEYYDILLKMDLIYAKASYAEEINASKPHINKDGIVELYQCYHPLLNVEKIITNNVFIGKDYQGIIITGPNTGGKTVLLKTLGLLSLMVKFGLLLPCNPNSNINIFDNVFADIGDEQSIVQNLSTFSSHIKNVIDIMNVVSENSLVLIDELGSGTDPVEGSSLAIAIIDYLLEKKCLIVTTSHYSELKIHAYNNDKIINASVEFDINTLQPTYKLLLGVPGQSNALQISKILGLSDEIIEKANKFAHNNDTNTNNILNKLVQQSQQLDQKLNELKAKEEEYDLKIEDANKLFEESIKQKNRILKDAENQSKDIIAKANKQINDIISDLEEMKLKEVKLHEVSEIKGRVKKLKEEVHYEEQIIPQALELVPNMSVFVENYGCYGIIIKKNKNNKYDVQIGNATMVIDKKYLKIAKNKDVKPTPTPKSNNNFSTKKNVSSTLDLRGKRYEEARDLLEKFIDDALYASLYQVSIIHGFGTGTIRELVHKTIKKYSKDIESYRYGGDGEGGQGVTIVTFKN